MKPDYSELPWLPMATCLIGEAHRRDLGNCQDAVAVRECNYLRPRSMTAQGRAIVAAVADGVGSHHYSEVGARVTATLACNLAVDGLLRGERPDALERRLSKLLPARLGELARLCRDDWQQCCYSTLVLAVATRDWLVVWACGDGFYSINGARPASTGVTLADRLPIDYSQPPEPGKDRPPMLTRLAELRTAEVRGAWIATDGARYLTNDGKPWHEHQDRALDQAPPVLAGQGPMRAWETALYNEAVQGTGRLRDDLGLVAFVTREPAADA